MIGAQPTEFEETEIKSIQRLSDFVSSIDPSNMKPSLENLDTFTQLINIALNIAEILEKHKGWDRSQRSENLIAIVKAIGYIIYNQQLEKTRAKPENNTSAEPERKYQEAIKELEEIFGAYKINLLNKEVGINEAEIIAFGDAHANPMQVIYQMLQTGIGYMPPDKLQELAKIYAIIDQKTSNIVTWETELKLQELERQGIPRPRSSLDVEEEVSKACELINEYFEYTGSPEVIHLGDLLADRGACDEIMLALLRKIKAKAGKRFVILASNHGPFLEDLGYEIPYYFDQTRSAIVGITCNPNYIRDLGRFLVDNTQLFYFDKRTNTFFTHCPITREHLKEFVKQANEVIADHTNYKLDRSQFNLRPLEIPQNDDPEKISQFVEDANEYYKAVMSWFFDFKDLSQSPDFKDFNEKRDLLPVKSLTAVVGTNIRLRDQGNNPAKPFNVTDRKSTRLNSSH